MLYDDIQIAQFNTFLRRFIIFLGFIAIINAIRVFNQDPLIVIAQFLAIACLVSLTYFVHPKRIIIALVCLAWLSVIASTLRLGSNSLAGIFFTTLGPVMIYFFTLRSVFLILALFLVSTVGAIFLAAHLKNIEIDGFFISLKIATYCSAAGFTAIFFNEFAIHFKRQLNKERRLRDAFEKQASIDELTQVLSRRAILAKAKQFSTTRIGIILLDIDFFKSINDLYGHHIGDLYLKAFAAKLSEILPADYSVGRIGGEEFLIVAHDDDEHQIQSFIAKCLVEIESLTIEIKGGLLSRTCSIGVCLHDPKLPIKVGIKYADTALYQAKLAGRNRSAWYTATD